MGQWCSFIQERGPMLPVLACIAGMTMPTACFARTTMRDGSRCVHDRPQCWHTRRYVTLRFLIIQLKKCYVRQKLL